MGIRTHRINIVSLTRIKLRQIIQVDCCFYGTVQCVFYNSLDGCGGAGCGGAGCEGAGCDDGDDDDDGGSGE